MRLALLAGCDLLLHRLKLFASLRLTEPARVYKCQVNQAYRLFFIEVIFVDLVELAYQRAR
jgi:hypothetical protein